MSRSCKHSFAPWPCTGENKHSLKRNTSKTRWLSLRVERTRIQYRHRPQQKLDYTPTLEDTVNNSWEEIVRSINHATEEALGRIFINLSSKHGNKKPWFTIEI